MKVSSTKHEGHNPNDLAQDSHAVSNATSPSDFLQMFMVQMTSDLPQGAEQDDGSNKTTLETPQSPENKIMSSKSGELDKNAVKTSPDNVVSKQTMHSSSAIGQLDLVKSQQISQKQNHLADPINKIISEQQQLSHHSLDPLMMKTLTQPPATDLSLQNQMIKQVQSQQASMSALQPKTGHLPEELLSDETKNILAEAGLDQALKGPLERTNKKMTSSHSALLGSQMNSLSSGVIGDHSATSEQLTQAIQQSLSITPLSLRAYKPMPAAPASQSMQSTSQAMDTMMQLGGLLNAQVAEHLGLGDTSSLVAPPVVTQTTYADSAQQIESRAEIELLPQTIESIMKESVNAQIKLYPPELGSVIAKLRVGKNSTELTIVTENDRVKQVVEASLTKLRDHFQQADISLSNVQVQTASIDSSAKQMNQQQQEKGRSLYSNDIIDREESSVVSVEPQKKKNTLVDTYA